MIFRFIKFFFNFWYIWRNSPTIFVLLEKRSIRQKNKFLQSKYGKVYINDIELEEPYLQPGVITDNYNGRGFCIDLIVPENSVFVMGDNRSQSTDSRCFGCIPLEKIESKVFIRIWPLNQFGKV